MFRMIFLYIFILVFIHNSKSEDEAIVQTSKGFLQGLKLNSVMGIPYFSFRGIPYAAPPLRELRFMAPQPPSKWNGLRDAKSDGAACIQPTIETHFQEKYSEDCLFVNVYTPRIKVQNENELLPVMVWIHGGGFNTGSGSSYKYGPDFFLAENVILVTFNYRLGVFGFLNMGTPDCQGNAGMKDQVAALRWVSKEIVNFGGNPNLVTIFGEGAGAVSVNHLYLSPLSQGLFHRAISQSGSSLCSFGYQPSTYELGLKLADLLGCQTAGDTQSIVICLKDADANDLTTEQLNGAIFLLQFNGVDKLLNFGYPFIPSLEQHLGEEIFLSKPPMKLIEAGGNKDIPYMFGFNSKEGGYFINDLHVTDDELLKYLVYFLPKDVLEKTIPQIREAILQRLERYYFKYDTKLEGFADFLTDRYFSYDIIRTVHLLDQKNIYLYYFQYVGNFAQSDDVCRNKNFSGVCHGGELGYMFYSNSTITAHRNITAGTKDIITLQRMVRLWTNFAKYGVPTVNIKDPLLPVTWDPIRKYSNHYLDIGKDLNMTYTSLYKYSAYLWDSLQQTPIGFPKGRKTFIDDYIDEDQVTIDVMEGFWSVGVFEIILILLFIVGVKAYGDHVYNNKRSEYVSLPV